MVAGTVGMLAALLQILLAKIKLVEKLAAIVRHPRQQAQVTRPSGGARAQL